MRKKVYMISLFLIFIVPFGVFADSNYDYRNGFFDKQDFTNVQSNNINRNIIDNDLGTFYEMPANRTQSIRFIKPVDVNAVYLAWTSTNFLNVVFKDGSSDLLTLSGFDDRAGYYHVNLKDVIRIDLLNRGNDSFRFNEFEIFIEEIEDIEPPDEVSNISIETNEDSAEINFDNPPDLDFDKVNLYLAGQVYSSSNGQIYIPNLNPETTYTAIIKTVDTLGNESEGVEVEFRTEAVPVVPPEAPEQVPEVRNLQMETDGERVDLSWEIPPQFYEKATIYRRDLGKVAAGFNFNPFAPMSVNANTDFKPLFETNGTTFSDLSIEPETEYDYKVTNTYNGMESAGVTVSVAVPKPPLINTDVEIPFGAGELIKTGNGLIGLIGGFLLLALSFILVPKIIALIKNANGGGKSSVAAERVGRIEREGKQPRVTDRQLNRATGNVRESRQPRATARQMRGV